MSDIRFNQWLHNSGTGGVSQVDGGHVGIGTTNPEIAVHSGNNKILNVGIVTANYFYGDGSNLSGVQVGGASSLSFNDNIGAYFGNSQDLKIHHDGNHSYIDDQGTGNLRLRSGTLEILNLAGNKTSAIFSSGGGQTLNFNNSTKFVTTNTGVVVTGIMTATQLKITSATHTLLASDSYNVLELRADENNDGGNDDTIFKMTHDGTFRSEIRFDESENQLEISTVDNANHFCIGSTGDIKILKNVGIQTNDVTRTNLVGAGSSLVGMYIGDGSILFNKTLNRTGGYYISTEVNALNAGPVTLDATMTLDGAWVIV